MSRQRSFFWIKSLDCTSTHFTKPYYGFWSRLHVDAIIVLAVSTVLATASGSLSQEMDPAQVIEPAEKMVIIGFGTRDKTMDIGPFSEAYLASQA